MSKYYVLEISFFFEAISNVYPHLTTCIFFIDNSEIYNPRNVPVVIVGHLLHNLAIDFIPQGFALSGLAENLVGEFQ